MQLRPVEFNGMIQNANEISHLQSHEDNKSALQQNMMHNAAEIQRQQDATSVHGNVKTETENLDEDGAGVIYKRPDKRKKKKDEKEDEKKKKHDDGRMYKKGEKPFDVKI
jgi:hypothetical protein